MVAIFFRNRDIAAIRFYSGYHDERTLTEMKKIEVRVCLKREQYTVFLRDGNDEFLTY